MIKRSFLVSLIGMKPWEAEKAIRDLGYKYRNLEGDMIPAISFPDTIMTSEKNGLVDWADASDILEVAEDS